MAQDLFHPKRFFHQAFDKKAGSCQKSLAFDKRALLLSKEFSHKRAKPWEEEKEKEKEIASIEWVALQVQAQSPIEEGRQAYRQRQARREEWNSRGWRTPSQQRKDEEKAKEEEKKRKN